MNAAIDSRLGSMAAFHTAKTSALSAAINGRYTVSGDASRPVASGPDAADAPASADSATAAQTMAVWRNDAIGLGPLAADAIMVMS